MLLVYVIFSSPGRHCDAAGGLIANKLTYYYLLAPFIRQRVHGSQLGLLH